MTIEGERTVAVFLEHVDWLAQDACEQVHAGSVGDLAKQLSFIRDVRGFVVSDSELTDLAKHLREITNLPTRKANSARSSAVRDLFLSQWSDADHFTAQLFRLIHKADAANRSRLAQAFPLEVSVFMEWFDSESEFEFFAKYKDELRFCDSRDSARFKKVFGEA